MNAAGCPFCGVGHSRPAMEATDFDTGRERFQLAECPGCGLARVENMPSEGELARYYEADYYGGGEAKFHPALEWLTRVAGRRRARRLLQVAPTDNTRPRVLDIGCGRGNLLSAFADLGCECHGVERSGFPAPPPGDEVHFHLGPLEQHGFADASFDLIVIWHVLEHLHEPGGTLAAAQRLLRPGGALVVAVPNFGSRQARWFGPDWFHLDLPRHLWHFTPAALDHAWRDLGLEKLTASGLSLEQNPYGFIQSAANRFLPGAPNSLYRAIKSRSWLQLLLWSPAVALLLPLALIETVASAGEQHGATLMQVLRKPELR